MTGLLRRLARQVVGPEPIKVHAIARLPFVAPPATIADEGAGQPHSETGVPSAAAPTNIYAWRAGRGEPSDRPRETAETPDRPPAQANSMPADAQTPARAAGELTGPTERRRSAVSADKTRVPALLLGKRPQTSPWHTGLDNTAMRVPAPREGVTAPTADPPPPATPRPVVTPPGAAGGERPADSGAGQPRRRQTRRRATPSSSRPDEAAEVHVHIGRIEITAVQEASAGRRKPAAGAQPLSLNEYLKRRRRGRS